MFLSFQEFCSFPCWLLQIGWLQWLDEISQNYQSYSSSTSKLFPRTRIFWHLRVKSALSCAFVWICTSVIPLIFCFCKCQYSLDFNVRLILIFPILSNILLSQMYVTKCAFNVILGPVLLMNTVIDCLIYLSYACSLATFCIYVVIFRFLRWELILSHLGRYF